MGRLDMRAIGYADNDTGGSRTHVSVRTVENEIIAGTSGVGDGSGGSDLRQGG